MPKKTTKKRKTFPLEYAALAVAACPGQADCADPLHAYQHDGVL